MLTIEQIYEALKKACNQADLNGIKKDVGLKELGYDSLDMFNILLELEALTGSEIPDEDIAKLQSVNQIYEYFGR